MTLFTPCQADSPVPVQDWSVFFPPCRRSFSELSRNYEQWNSSNNRMFFCCCFLNTGESFARLNDLDGEKLQTSYLVRMDVWSSLSHCRNRGNNSQSVCDFCPLLCTRGRGYSHTDSGRRLRAQHTAEVMKQTERIHFTGVSGAAHCEYHQQDLSRTRRTETSSNTLPATFSPSSQPDYSNVSVFWVFSLIVVNLNFK